MAVGAQPSQFRSTLTLNTLARLGLVHNQGIFLDS